MMRVGAERNVAEDEDVGDGGKHGHCHDGQHKYYTITNVQYLVPFCSRVSLSETKRIKRRTNGTERYIVCIGCVCVLLGGVCTDGWVLLAKDAAVDGDGGL